MSGTPPLVALIMSQPQMADRLEAQHADDGTGRCRCCSAGAQTGRYQHPCDIRLAVDEARRRGGVREEIVRDVVERHIPAASVAATWGVRIADVEQWVRDAETDAQTD
jgi:hypothetical protein